PGASAMFTHKRLLYATGFWLAVAAGSPALAQSQNHYGFGTPIGQQDLAKFFTIPADGTGLPAGSGTATAGAKGFGDSCAACHGDKGQGNPAKGVGGDRPLLGRLTPARPRSLRFRASLRLRPARRLARASWRGSACP